MISQNFHKDFRLNGKQFNSKIELLAYSKNLFDSIFNFLADWFNDKDYIVVKTSGSTGKPKHIRLQKEQMMNSAIATGDYFNLPSKTMALLCLSTDFIAGKMMLVRALTLGWHLDMIEADSHPLRSIAKKYDFSAMVPLQVYNSLNKLSQIKKLIVGGGVISKELEMKLQNISTECFATYGMTETSTHIAVKKLNHFDKNGIARKTEQSHYSTLPDIKISKDNRNCLVIDAPKISDKQLITNDLVEIISDTEFKWLGRYDNIINSGGIKLIPEQIEAKLAKVIDHRFFVAGIADEVLGEKLILIVEKDVTSSDSQQANCIEKLSDVVLNKTKNLNTISKYEIPKEIYFVQKFIETKTRKIQRRKTLDLILLIIT